MPRPLGGWWAGRAGLVFPLILFSFATYLLVGQIAMPVPDDVDLPGPRFFPTIVIVALYSLAVVLAVSIVRAPQPPLAEVTLETEGKVRQNPDHGTSWFSDWPRLAWATGGFAAFILLLQPAGWIVAAAILFWAVARALDSKHPLRDVGVALVFSSVLYLIFAGVLSVNLPTGALFGGRL
ncbi:MULTISPECIES: tripartite tricarboxylate transporter TctB family protein [unclassified Microbacterium]|uniref:tripartite tricarboxylate transporter TctB family protein n=1 Tax=unclassified Microbacterium TaxID=2609290 RepID=UPI003464EEE1